MKMPQLVGAVAMVALLGACIAPAAPEHIFNVAPADAPPGPVVALINSNASKSAMLVTDAFIRNTQFTVQEYNLSHGVSEQGVVSALAVSKPSVIVAFGGHAVQLAHQYYPAVPLVYSMVAQDESHPIVGDHVRGVGLELSTTTEFTMYRLVLGKDLRRVLTYYTPGRSDGLVARAKQELESLGLTLIALPATKQSLGEPARKKEIEGVDAVWWFNDPGIMSKDTFAQALQLANAAHKPLLCSSFRELAAAGALMAFTLDFDNMGAQIAELVEDTLQPSAESVPTAGLRQPLGGHLVFNGVTAEKLAIQLPATAQPFVSEVISSAH